MTAGKFDAATSPADIMHRLRNLEREVAALRTARTLESASIGAGGMRIQGGLLRVQDTDGDDMFRAGGDPGEIFLRDDLLAPFAVDILGSRIHSATTAAQILVDSTTYLNLGGPQLGNIDIISGRALVFLTALVLAPRTAGENIRDGVMGVQVSGATDIDPNDDPNMLDTLRVGANALPTIDTIEVRVRASAAVWIPNLNPGVHSFGARYRTFGNGTEDVLFMNRTITVIAF